MDAFESPTRWLSSAWRELAGWLAPAACVGCAQLPFALCDSCRASLSYVPQQVGSVAGQVPVWAACDYSGVVASLVRELKTHGSRMAARALTPALTALAAADRQAVHADVVVIPPSRRAAFRARGFHPIALVADAAGLSIEQPFEVAAAVRDQRTLSFDERQRNLDHAFVVRDRWVHRLRGARVLLLDDVTTTGATLRELARASESAGATVVSAWALAHTPRRSARATQPPNV